MEPTHAVAQSPDPRSDSFETGLAQAVCQVEAGEYAEAVPALARLHEGDPDHARARSYYGLCLALEEHRFDDGVALCRSAIKQEFFNPTLYYNMARIHLAFGFKTEAIRYLRRGLLIDPGDRTIRELLERLGQRERQVIGFLPRKHPLNRLLGRVRARFGRAMRVPAAA